MEENRGFPVRPLQENCHRARCSWPRCTPSLFDASAARSTATLLLFLLLAATALLQHPSHPHHFFCHDHCLLRCLRLRPWDPCHRYRLPPRSPLLPPRSPSPRPSTPPCHRVLPPAADSLSANPRRLLPSFLALPTRRRPSPSPPSRPPSSPNAKALTGRDEGSKMKQDHLPRPLLPLSRCPSPSPSPVAPLQLLFDRSLIDRPSPAPLLPSPPSLSASPPPSSPNALEDSRRSHQPSPPHRRTHLHVVHGRRRKHTPRFVTVHSPEAVCRPHGPQTSL